jgi:ubiquinone/menaquinone biosynthesis C-methylase UbiE
VDDGAGAALEWVHERLRAFTRGRVIDIGCGEGRFLPRGAVGLDLDPARLTMARERSPRLVQADARALPFSTGAFDTAYAIRMLNDTGDVARALAEAARVLRPAGTLLVFTRARRAEGDRLDRWNGVDRLRPYFAAVSMEVPAFDERAALFVAERPLR